MDFLDLTLETPAADLALDEALLLEAEAGRSGEVLRVWERPQFAVVLGSGCKLVEDVKEAACERDGVPVLRRSSGGGTVLLGQGCLLFSVVLRMEQAAELAAIHSSYAYILGRVVDALRSGVTGIEAAGISDLAVRGLKFSGNAQQRKRHHLLHHGTLLYAFPLEVVSTYLHMPQRQPEYRQNREHYTFLCNLPIGGEELVARLRQAFGADQDLETWPAELVQQLVVDKYASRDWTRRR
jgi:lipoate---protein ligase